MLALSLLVVATGCHVQISDGYTFDYRGETASRSESGLIESNVTTIKINNKFGDVYVEKTDSEGSWTWTGKTWATEQEDADLFLDELQMDIKEDGDTQTWTIALPEKSKFLRGVKSDLTIQVPSKVNVELVNSHGTVSANGLDAETSIQNAHGKLDVTDISGVSTIKNRHGQSNLSDLSGTCELSCEHGRVNIKGTEGELTVKCRHGRLEIEEASGVINTDNRHGRTNVSGRCDRIRCDAGHGSVNIELENSNFESIRVDASHSNVTIDLPSSAKPRVTMSARHGNTQSEFDSNDESNAPKIAVTTAHGNIKVRKK